MGLLDALNSRDGIFALGLLDAASPRPVRTSMGGGLLAAMQGAQRWQQDQEDRASAAEERKRRAEMQALQQQMLQAQIGETQAQAQQRRATLEQTLRQQAAMQQFRDQIPSPQAQAVSQALQGGGGPTNANAQAMPRVDPFQQQMYGAMQSGLIDPMAYLQAQQPKPADYKVVGNALVQVGPQGVKEAYRAPDAPEKTPEALRTLEMIYGKGSPQYMQAAQQLAQKMTTHQPGVNVTYGAPVAGVDGGGNPIYFQPSKDGGAPSILKGVAPPTKDMPSGMAEKFAQNSVTLGKIDQALGLVKKNPAALGAQNYLPDAVVQRIDPGGTDVRALVADIGGQKIHDRSGAAVTVSEAARLKPYIPAATDTPQVAAQKLELFRQEYMAMQRALAAGASIRQAVQGSAGSAPAGVDDLVRKYTGGT